MNIIKKSLSVVLAVLMIMSAFSCLALADLSYAYPTEFNGGFTKTTTAADYFNQVFSKPVYSKAPAKKYAELSAANSTKDLWAYIAVEVYEKNSGVWELSDHYLTPGQDVQFRFYVKGNFSTTTAQLAFLFSKSFFDTPDVDPDPLIGAYNTANTYGAMQNPITDAAINFYNNAGTYKNTARKTYIPSAVNDTVGCLGFMGSTPMSNPKSVAMNSDEPVFIYDSKVKTGLADNTIGYTFFEKSALSARPDCNYFTVMKTANASAEATTTFAESSMALADVDTRDCNQAFIIGTPAAQTYTITYMDGANAITGLTPTSYTAGVGATLPTSVSKTDCKFEGWYDNDNLTGNAVTSIGTDATGDKTFYAKFSPLTTTANYKVEHYVMDVTGNYPEAATKTENKSGTINATLTLANYKDASLEVANGIAYKEGKVGSAVATTTTIAADGSTVLKLYYERSKYQLTVTAGTGVSAASVKVNGAAFTSGNDVYYDAPITDYSATAQANYGTPTWNSQPTKMPASKLTLTATAEVLSGIKFSVEHYVMDVKGDYPSAATKTAEKSGTAGATITLADYKDASLEVANGIAYKEGKVGTAVATTTAIAADGSTVIKLYYARSKYQLTVTAGTGVATASVKVNGAAFTSGNDVYYDAPITDYSATAQANYGTPTWNSQPTKMPASKLTLTATAEVLSGIEFTVEHYVMDVKGDYPATATKKEDKSGSAGATLTLASYKDASLEVANGIAYKEGKVGSAVATTTTIAADGSTVIKLYYERSKYKLTVSAGTGVSAASVKVNSAAFTSGNDVYYDAPITDYSATAKAGYGTPTWTSQPTKMPASALTLTASATANTNTAYKVNVYVMDAAGKYGDPTVKNCNGTTDTLATVTDAMIAGYCSEAGSSDAFSKDDAKTNVLSGNIDGNGSRVLTVYLKRAQYTLTLKKGTGIDSVTGAGTYYFGQSVTINAVVNANYNWSKWSDDVTTQQRTFTMPDYALEYTANAVVKSGVTYKVEHYVMDVKGDYPATANSTEPGSGTAGATLTLSALKKDSYEVANGIAYKEGTVGGQKVTSTTIAADGSTVIKLYYERAQYVLTVVADTGVATATVKVNGAAFTSGNKVYYGAAITDYTATAEAGYGEPEWDAKPATMPAEALTVTASVSASGYKAIFKPDGGKWADNSTSQKPKNYTVEDVLTAPATISKVGYNFIGWKVTTAAGNWVLDTVYNNKADQTKLAGVAGQTGSVTFTAQWDAIKYKVTFADYEGNEIYTADVPYGKTPVYDEATYGVPTKPADADNTYSFTGWKNGDNGLMAVTGDITYVAQFAPVGKTYKVTFNVADQTPSVFERANKAVITIADPTYEKGYVFLGWYDGEGDDAKLVSKSFATTGYTVSGADATFYAHFEKGKFTAKFVWGSEDNQYFTTDEILFGETYEFKQTPAEDANVGFIFKGWALKEDAKEADKVTSFTMGDGKDVYYAIWVRDLSNCGIKSVVSSTNGDYFNIGIANYTVTFNANQNPTAIKVVDENGNTQIFTKASFEEFASASGIASINTAPGGDSWVLEMVLPAGKYLVIMGYDNDGETVYDDANPFEYERTYDEITKQTDLANEKIKITDALVPVVDDTTEDTEKADVAVLNGNRLKYVIEADTSIFYIKAVTTYKNGDDDVSYTNLYKQTTNLGDENIFSYKDGVWTIAPLYSAAVDGQVQTTKFYYRYNYSDVWMTLKVDNEGTVEDYSNTVEVKNQLNVKEIAEEAKTVKVAGSDKLEGITAGKQTIVITTAEDVQRIRLVWNGTKNATFTRESGNCGISELDGVVTWTITDFNFKAGVTYELQTRTDKWNSTWKTITVSA